MIPLVGGNVRGFSCYHLGDYNTLNDSQKEELQGHGQKKLLKVTESAIPAEGTRFSFVREKARAYLSVAEVEERE